MSRRRPLRLRLTLLYAGAVAVSGAVLVAVTYALVAATVADQPVDTVGMAVDGSPQSVLIDMSGDEVAVDAETGEPVVTLDEIAGAVAAVNITLRDDTLSTLLTRSLLVLGVVVVLAGLLGWVVASRALAPLHRITATARRVADDNLGGRIALSGPRDEIRELADTFDEMMDRLDRSFDGQRRFVALASHELRTPLTITRTVLEVALDDPDTPAETRALGERLLGVNARHERLIDGLLTLAVAEQSPASVAEVDLADLAGTVVDHAGSEAADRSVRIDLDTAAAPVQGDALLLERLLQNLVDNAVRHNEAGGFVRVAVAAVPGPEGEVAEVVVENSGPLVPAEEVDALTEPFRQFTGADRRRGLGGVGLGLSIVRAVATAHEGSLELAARPEGGLRATVRLPLAPRPAPVLEPA